MFGFGNIRKYKRTIAMQEELIDNLYGENNTLLEKCIKLERALLEQKAPRKNRKPISRTTGYKKVTKDESLEIYKMYKNGYCLSYIANRSNRSQSCISRHVRIHLEAEDE